MIGQVLQCDKNTLGHAHLDMILGGFTSFQSVFSLTAANYCTEQ